MIKTRTNLRAAGAALTLFTTFALGACGSDEKAAETTAAAVVTEPAATETSAAAAAPVTGSVLTISGFQFSKLTVAAGQGFTVANEDGAPHTVTADDGSFDIRVGGGETAAGAVATPGSYPIHCEIHTDMHGDLIVT